MICDQSRFDTIQPSIGDKAKDQLAAQTKDNFGFKKAAHGYLPGRPSPPCPITLHNPPKDIRLRHKCLLSDREADADVIHCTESPYTYIIGKNRVDIQSNVTPSSSDSSPQNDQPQSKVMIYGNRRIQSGREAWEVPDATSFYVENHMKELFEIRSKSSKLVFGGYGGGPLSPPAKARGWITTLSKKLQMKYDNSLLNSDQRSNRNRKKIERGASFSSLSAVSSPFLDEVVAIHSWETPLRYVVNSFLVATYSVCMGKFTSYNSVYHVCTSIRVCVCVCVSQCVCSKRCLCVCVSG